MKKKNFKLIAILVAIMTLCLLTTACMGQQGATGPTPDPSIASPELQQIAIRHNASMFVNMRTALAYVYYAGAESDPIKAEDLASLTVRAYKYVGEETVELDESEYQVELGDDGIITVKSSEIGEIRITAVSNAEKTAEATIPVARQTLTIWDIILLGIGLYALYMGITGRGKIYETEFLKEGCESRYKATTRIACLVVSVCMVGSGVVAAIDAYGAYSLIKTILFAVGIAVLIASIILTNSMIDKAARKEAQIKQSSGRDLKAPAAAFDFDDQEPTVDDLKK